MQKANRKSVSQSQSEEVETNTKVVKKSVKKIPVVQVVLPVPVVPVVVPVPVVPVPDSSASSTTNLRKAPTYESVFELFDEIIKSVNEEINSLRECPGKTKGVKYLRSLNKSVKVLRNQTTRVIKQKPKSSRTSNKNSGFLKPVAISDEMARFTGWDSQELKSRVEVTKYICDYIKENGLQDASDRRQIKPDSKLQKLLGLTSKKQTEPLRYYSLQTHLKQHFPKAAVV